jgi:hypothetical protein
MLAELERGSASSAEAGPDQFALRKKTVHWLVVEESGHEAVEEMYFWPAVRGHRVPFAWATRICCPGREPRACQLADGGRAGPPRARRKYLGT